MYLCMYACIHLFIYFHVNINHHGYKSFWNRTEQTGFAVLTHPFHKFLCEASACERERDAPPQLSVAVQAVYVFTVLVNSIGAGWHLKG